MAKKKRSLLLLENANYNHSNIPFRTCSYEYYRKDKATMRRQLRGESTYKSLRSWVRIPITPQKSKFQQNIAGIPVLQGDGGGGETEFPEACKPVSLEGERPCPK